MTDKENFPGRWQGVVPEDLKLVTQGQAGIRVDLTICLECLQHLAWPVYKPLEKLKVLDPACGTGEQLLQMAVKYGIDSYTAYDPSPAALQQARDYAKQLGLENVNYVDALPSEGKYDLIIMTRPLQHIDNLADFMQTLKNSLAPDGLLIVHAYTGANPEENLYLREEIAALKADQLGAEEFRT
jgi:2-polyprenyl-3-methyl-5-hydroxy-6-metoxy-1,4-benzoquinol methylase